MVEDQVAFPLGLFHLDLGVPTSAADGLWNRRLRSSHDPELWTGRHVVDTSNREMVGQMIRDPKNVEGGDLVAT